MKQITTLILIVASHQGLTQSIYTLDKPKVDTRVELLSIVFRLAECEEFSSNRFKLYSDKIENHFKQFKNHELIFLLRK
jgi:hypothetical protein